MVEILAGGAVAAGRENSGGCGTDEEADLTVREECICSAIGQVRDEKGGWRIGTKRRTYVLMRKVLREVGNKGCEVWEANHIWLSRNLGTSKTSERLRSRNGNFHNAMGERDCIPRIHTILNARRIYSVANNLP